MHTGAKAVDECGGAFTAGVVAFLTREGIARKTD